jgi:hypothetical protein
MRKLLFGKSTFIFVFRKCSLCIPRASKACSCPLPQLPLLPGWGDFIVIELAAFLAKALTQIPHPNYLALALALPPVAPARHRPAN